MWPNQRSWDVSIWSSPVTTGRLLGAETPQTKLQAPSNGIIKHYKSVEFFIKFQNVKAPEQTQSTPIENFLATVLLSHPELFAKIPSLPLVQGKVLFQSLLKVHDHSWGSKQGPI